MIRSNKGFSLLEALIGIAVFLLIAVSAWQAFGAILEGTKVLRIKSAAINLANEQIEIAHNLPYADVGIVDGLPAGKLLHEQVIDHGNGAFNVTTTVRNIDEEFDGTIGGAPNDTSPADNKLVEIEVECANQCGVPPIVLSTRIAPLALENTGNNGALFVQVFNSSGLPIEGADVHIENNATTTPIIIDDVTAVNGMLQLVDVPPGQEAYEVTVTKDGYSTERTYASDDPENPIPDKAHSTVVAGSVTQISFSIDELSDLSISTRDVLCGHIGNVDFSMQGAKTIGYEVLKYDEDHSTNSSGNLSLDGMEWDTYTFNLIDSLYDLSGTNPITPLDLAPATNQHIDLIVHNKDPNGLLVKVYDGSTSLPVADATVTLVQGAEEYTGTTGQGFLSQTDWSGGPGQADFIDEIRYLSDDLNIETQSPTGEIRLYDFSGSYASSGELISSTFDVGTTTNFRTLEWLPGNQPPQVGSDSVRIQVATNVDNTATSTWDFVGPDGTALSYFTTPGESFSSIHNGDRYLRYRVLLSTEDTSYTPSLSELSFTFSAECAPSGQVYLHGIGSGNHNLTVEAAGYQTLVDHPVDIQQAWQEESITLTP